MALHLPSDFLSTGRRCGEIIFFLKWHANSILTDPHSPGLYRANGPVSNLDPWYDAFNVKEGDKMYKPKSERIAVW